MRCGTTHGFHSLNTCVGLALTTDDWSVFGGNEECGSTRLVRVDSTRLTADLHGFLLSHISMNPLLLNWLLLLLRNMLNLLNLLRWLNSRLSGPREKHLLLRMIHLLSLWLLCRRLLSILLLRRLWLMMQLSILLLQLLLIVLWIVLLVVLLILLIVLLNLLLLRLRLLLLNGEGVGNLVLIDSLDSLRVRR